MPPPLLAISGSRVLRRKLQMVVETGFVSPIVGPLVLAGSRHELDDLVERHPTSPVVVDAAFLGEPDSPVPRAIVLRTESQDSVRAVERAVLMGIDPQRPDRLRARMRERVAAEACRIMDRVLARSFAPCRVPELAADLGLSHLALIRRCAALDIPTPKKLLDLGRVYTVERLAEWSERPSGVAAKAVGFLESSHYRRTVRRGLGAPPTVVRRRGGVAHVDRAIIRRLSPPEPGQARPCRSDKK